MGLFNTTCTYAIRAVLQVAVERPQPGEFVSTRRVAETLGVSFAFLSKVLRGLTQSGILLSQRGATGGVALARPAEAISLLDVVEAAGGDGIFHDCVLGLPFCSDASPCVLHPSWKEQRSDLESLFTSTTLADLVRDGEAMLSEDPSQLTDRTRVRAATPRRPT